MAYSSVYIFFIIFSCLNILCQGNNDEYLNEAYSKMSNLPVGSTIYFTRNFKCSNYHNESSICLIDKSLYIISKEKKDKLLDIAGYSDYFYYELILYNDIANYINCVIVHFFNKTQIIFQYYKINTINLVCESSDYTYIYNDKNIDPINKGISCYAKDKTFQINCVFINEGKKVNNITLTKKGGNVLSSIKEEDIQNYNNYINNNTLIIPTDLTYKLKFFSCSYYQTDELFNIFIKRPSISQNNIKTHTFTCNNNEKLFLFDILNKECSSHIDCTRYIDHKNFINLNIFSFLKVNGPLSEAVLASISNYETLIMDVLENAVFFQPKKEIKNFYFDPNFQFQDELQKQKYLS